MVKNTKGGSSHKKLARKKEDDMKKIKVDLNVNFKENIIVLVDKNIGTCFTARLIHTDDDTSEFKDKELKVLHQRGRNAKRLFNRVQSKLALVSIIKDFKLSSGCIGYVEEFLEINHLNEYKKHNLISVDTYDKLCKYINSNSTEITEKTDDFEFDRNNLLPDSDSDSDDKSNKLNQPIQKKIVSEPKKVVINTPKLDTDSENSDLDIDKI